MGGYPVLHSEVAKPAKWYPNYISTYVERDVRMIENISCLDTYERFLRLCAGRIGQLHYMSSMAVEAGVDVKTKAARLSARETSFVLFRLKPCHKNDNKRIVKIPKSYSYDTRLAISLLSTENSAQSAINPFRRNLFENMMIVELLKKSYHTDKSHQLFFWPDNMGNELDLLINKVNSLLPVEVKSGQTFTDDYFKGLLFWNKITATQGGYIVYGGKMTQN